MNEDRASREIEKLENWTFSLQVAEKALSAHAHIEHFSRLRDMQDYFRRKLRELQRELMKLE